MEYEDPYHDRRNEYNYITTDFMCEQGVPHTSILSSLFFIYL